MKRHIKIENLEHWTICSSCENRTSRNNSMVMEWSICLTNVEYRKMIYRITSSVTSSYKKKQFTTHIRRVVYCSFESLRPMEKKQVIWYAKLFWKVYNLLPNGAINWRPFGGVSATVVILPQSPYIRICCFVFQILRLLLFHIRWVFISINLALNANFIQTRFKGTLLVPTTHLFSFPR